MLIQAISFTHMNNCRYMYKCLSVSKEIIRGCSTRVRFAPSPTGSLHLGGLRTAWYNYLFAKQRAGKCILRIEDTDQSRVKEKTANEFEDILAWAGIEVNESPLVGGPYGPYVQSKRLNYYHEFTKRLLNSSAAYYCFCSEHRLDLLRKQALRNREVPRYDNKCRTLSKMECQERLGRKEPYCIRFKYCPQQGETFHDLVHGRIPMDLAEHEGDFILLKSDGYPTYHLANVVDDLLMRISHVLRGKEWLMSTPKHILLYRALEEIPPHFGHFPLLINPDGTKLSKRQSAMHITTLRDGGIYPIPLLNFMSRLGGGFPHSGEIHFDKRYFVSSFDIKNVGTSPAKLQLDLLSYYNRKYLENVLNDGNENTRVFILNFGNMLREKYPEFDCDLNSDYLVKVLKWSISRVNTFNELLDDEYSYLWLDVFNERVAEKLSHNQFYVNIVADLVLNSTSDDFGWEQFKKSVKDYSKKANVKYAHVMQTFRLCLTSKTEGPSIVELFEIFDRKRIVFKVEQAINCINQGK